MCDLRRLADARMVVFGEDGVSIQPTPLGTLMARFCVKFDTMASFSSMPSGAGLEHVLQLLAECAEFRDLYLRQVTPRLELAVSFLLAVNQHHTLPTCGTC